MPSGVIKRIVADKGFGFIGMAGGQPDHFFHRSGVTGNRFDALREGQRVEFDVEDSPKGPRATNVREN